jgi:hypothetical protein
MRRTKLFKLAALTGCEIINEGCRTLIKSKEGFAVAVYSDGTAHRADIDLSLTKNMTLNECAEVLDLKEAK